MQLKKITWATCSLFLLNTSSLVLAQGIVLNDSALRNDLNWLNQQGVIQISTSTWPMSSDAIQSALSQAKVSHPHQDQVIQAVKKQLNQDTTVFKVGALAESTQKNLPQQFADDQKAQYQIFAEANWGADNWDARLRINAEKDLQVDSGRDVNIEGSYLAGKKWNQWLVAGQIPTYWGPGHDGSLIRGDVSRPVYGVTLQRAQQSAFDLPWLAWVGPWQYQAFAGQLDQYQAIPNAKLISLRLTAQPLPYLELAASRAIQWGGEGRPQSFSSLWDAFVGNKDNGGTGEPDPSNQIAGFDARFNLGQLLDVPLSIYGQYVGEDEAGALPSKKMYLAGVDYASSFQDKPYQVYAEWVDTRTNGQVRGISYNHSVYRDGYYQHGFSLGHGLGGDAEMISVGANVRLDPHNRVEGRALVAKLADARLAPSTRPINLAFPKADEIRALDVTWTHDLRDQIPVKMNVWVSDSDRESGDVGASIGVEIPLKKGIFSF